MRALMLDLWYFVIGLKHCFSCCASPTGRISYFQRMLVSIMSIACCIATILTFGRMIWCAEENLMIVYMSKNREQRIKPSERN